MSTSTAAGTVLLERKWSNSLGEGQENSLVFYLVGDRSRIVFESRVLFDATQYDWDNMRVSFPREKLADCLAHFRQQGQASFQEGRCSLEFIREIGHILLRVHANDGSGVTRQENLEIPEIPDSMYELLGVV